MVWSKYDFAREVERQLVELASIRKRAAADAELLERVERLETSHHYLLRKLYEFFQSLDERRKRKRRPAGRARVSPEMRWLQKALRDGIRGLEPRACGRTPSGAPRVQETATALRCARRGTKRHLRLPRLDDLCARCGGPLVWSILAGETLVAHAGSWYHGRCLKRSGGVREKRPLN